MVRSRTIRIGGRAGILAAWLVLASGVGAASADERYALVISGASGGPKYTENHDRWRAALVQALRNRLRFRDENLIVLSERGGPGAGRASRDAVRRALQDLAGRMTRQSMLLVVLIGHGTYDGVDAKFNLVGPDLEAEEWRRRLGALPGRLVVVNTTSASFPFLERLAGPGRIVITATDSAAQRFETVFPEFFTQAFDNEAADLDKNGRVSIWEAFTHASLRVREWYEQRGLLATERAVLDDTGDGVGKEAGAPGPDGSLARRVFLDPDLGTATVDDPVLAELLDRRVRLELEVEALKAQKGAMAPERYRQQIEQLLLELARVSRQIRSKS